METIGFAEMSVNSYQPMLPNNPQEGRPYLHPGESFKSRKFLKLIINIGAVGHPNLTQQSDNIRNKPVAEDITSHERN
jgi:hypothetical protein